MLQLECKLFPLKNYDIDAHFTIIKLQIGLGIALFSNNYFSKASLYIQPFCSYHINSCTCNSNIKQCSLSLYIYIYIYSCEIFFFSSFIYIQLVS